MARYVDFDTHVYEPVSVWSEYLDSQFRDRSPRLFDDTDGRMKLEIAGNLYPASPGHPGYRKIYGADSTVDRSGNDPQVRLNYMDAHDADVQVVFPTLGMAGFSTGVKDPQLAVALARAYNRYMGEFCSIDRRRLRGAMLTPVNHPELAAAEMERALRQDGLSIAFMNPTPPDDIPWSHPSREPFWKAANDLGITIVFHESTVGAPSHAVGINRYAGSWPMIYLCTHVIEAMLAMADVLLGGILERHPKLRLGVAEAHIHWVPGLLALLDQQFGTATRLWKGESGEIHTAMKPSDYFRRQCFVAAFPDDNMIADTMAVAKESVVVCSDWPHPIASEFSADGLHGVEKNTSLPPGAAQTLLVDNPKRFL